MRPTESTALGIAIQGLCNSLGLEFERYWCESWRLHLTIANERRWLCTIYVQENNLRLTPAVGANTNRIVGHLTDPHLLRKLKNEISQMTAQNRFTSPSAAPPPAT